MNRRILARLGVGAALSLTSAGLMLGSGIAAHAAGPEGCAAQGPNGVVAAGTVTDGSGAPPNSSPPTASCSFKEATGGTGAGGGIAGGDSAGWSVTLNMAPGAGTPACTGTNNGNGTWTIKGTGQAACGLGTIPQGAAVTVTAK